MFLARVDLQRVADRAEQVGNTDGTIGYRRAVGRTGSDHLPTLPTATGAGGPTTRSYQEEEPSLLRGGLGGPDRILLRQQADLELREPAAAANAITPAGSDSGSGQRVSSSCGCGCCCPLLAALAAAAGARRGGGGAAGGMHEDVATKCSRWRRRQVARTRRLASGEARRQPDPGSDLLGPVTPKPPDFDILGPRRARAEGGAALTPDQARKLGIVPWVDTCVQGQVSTRRCLTIEP